MRVKTFEKGAPSCCTPREGSCGLGLAWTRRCRATKGPGARLPFCVALKFFSISLRHVVTGLLGPFVQFSVSRENREAQDKPFAQFLPSVIVFLENVGVSRGQRC